MGKGREKKRTREKNTKEEEMKGYYVLSRMASKRESKEKAYSF